MAIEREKNHPRGNEKKQHIVTGLDGIQTFRQFFFFWKSFFFRFVLFLVIKKITAAIKRNRCLRVESTHGIVWNTNVDVWHFSSSSTYGWCNINMLISILYQYNILKKYRCRKYSLYVRTYVHYIRCTYVPSAKCQKQLQFHDFFPKIILHSDLRGQTVMYTIIWVHTYSWTLPFGILRKIHLFLHTCQTIVRYGVVLLR